MRPPRPGVAERRFPGLAFLSALLLALAAGCAGRAVRPPEVRPVDLDQQDRRLVWPLPIVSTARVTSRFGRRKDPFSGLSQFHTGVDLDGEIGTPVHAAGGGKVIFAHERSGYGLLVIIDHGKGLTTYYGHCSRLLAKDNQKVDRGQVIALMGDSGRALGSHLHFETRKNGQPFDPFSLLPELKNQ